MVTKIRVYRNLTRGCWSILEKGRVIRHTSFLALSNCTFIVNPKGHQRVLDEHQKNVHAFVEGQPTMLGKLAISEIKYNPYKYNSFVWLFGEGDPIPVSGAEFLYFYPDGTVLGCGIEVKL